MPVKTMNLTEAAAELGLAPSTVRQRILAGDLAAEKDGGRWVIYSEQIEHYRRKRQYQPEKGCQKYRRTPNKRTAELTEAEKKVLEECGIRWQ